MGELAEIVEFEQWQKALMEQLNSQAESFIKTGFLLKRARDDGRILQDSGYQTIAAYAKAVLNMDKDVVSRYIAINDRYSENGYSERIQERYAGYGLGKLQDMLTMSDVVVDLLPKDMPRREIQEIKREIREEEQKTDIEVILEGTAPEHENMTILQKFFYEYFHEKENREQFVLLEPVIGGGLPSSDAVEKILDVLAPSGIAHKTTRIQGTGKIALFFDGKDRAVKLLLVRQNEKQEYAWEEFVKQLQETFDGKGGRAGWELTYKETFSPKVAPVQPEKEEKTEKPEPDIPEPEEQKEQQGTGKPGTKEEPGQKIPPESATNDGMHANGEAFSVPQDTEGEGTPKEPCAMTGRGTLKGYKAAVTNSIHRMEKYWEDNNLSGALAEAKDIQRRLEQIMKLAEEEEDGE